MEWYSILKEKITPKSSGGHEVEHQPWGQPSEQNQDEEKAEGEEDEDQQS